MVAMSKPATGTTTWALKGVREETREAVREAAAQADLLIGEWVDQALLEAAREALHPAPPPATKADVATILKELAELKESVRTLRERGDRHERPPVRHVMVERRPRRQSRTRGEDDKGDRGS
jgi:hypothetical protein